MAHNHQLHVYLYNKHVNDPRVPDVRVSLEFFSQLTPTSLNWYVQVIHLHSTRHLYHTKYM